MRMRTYEQNITVCVCVCVSSTITITVNGIKRIKCQTVEFMINISKKTTHFFLIGHDFPLRANQIRASVWATTGNWSDDLLPPTVYQMRSSPLQKGWILHRAKHHHGDGGAA